MSLLFKKYTSNAPLFFEILPKDWQEEIVPCWGEYAKNTKAYVLLQDQILIGGGLVFSTVSPDMKPVAEIADKYFQRDLLCIAYIWITEKERNKGFGKFWLQQLIDKNPTQGYWLSIEALELVHFYEPLGFKIAESYMNNDHEEWIMVRSV